MTVIIDGKKVAGELLENLKEKINKLDKSIKRPSLAVILANDDPASEIYVSSKEKKAKELGFNSFIYKFDKTVKQQELINLIQKLNSDPEINALLLQLPLFEHLNPSQLIELINPIKDVDGFHPLNIGKLNSALEPFCYPCTPLGIIKLLDYYKIDVASKEILVIGRSNITGRPVASMLVNKNATVTLAHSKTKNLGEISKTKDIIISATGVSNLITKEMVKDNAVVVDVGITKKNDKLTGDVDFNSVKEKTSFITPVPGGVGPMTIACLMENTYKLFLKQNNLGG